MAGHLITQTAQNAMSMDMPKLGELVYSQEANVYALLPGTVSAVFSIGRDHYTMVQTGNIYIVYAELETCRFRKGDTIEQHQIVGRANYSEVDRSYRINVQAWRTEDGTSREDKELLLALVQ